MLGHSHSQSGSTAWSGAVCLAPLVGVHPHWPAISAGVLATAGAALLPDLDHPEATIAHTFGPVSKAAARIVHRMSGGHRHATHSLLFAVAAPLATWVMLAFGGIWFAIPALFVLFAFGVRALHLAPSLTLTVATVTTGAAWFVLRGDYGWLPWSVGIGVLAHLAGDCLTKEGCPLLWPHRAHYMLPIVQRTGNRVETMLISPLFALGTVALLAFGR
jgi:membrane-bound metal-dependent hydrolase YbcI (DUF457 family)